MDISSLKARLDAAQYVCDDGLATTLLVALQLGRPLLIEGAAGVGKTEIAKVMASALDRELVRLQCYEGLDESKALYEWNYQKQLLSIQVRMNRQDPDELTRSLFSDEYLLERPLLRSIRSEKPVVLLIDEIDKADEEFEAFLLELLSEMQVTIPEVGTMRAKSVPFVVLTSNRARPLSEALRRRCAYLYIPYPDVEKEVAIIRAKLPHAGDRLAVQVAQAVHDLRENDAILKKPSIAETLDWVSALEALGISDLDREAARRTLGFVLKSSEDMEAALACEGDASKFVENMGGNAYYAGLAEGFVDASPLNEAVAAPNTKAVMDAVRELIVSGEWDVFSGLIETNEGEVVCEEGQTLDDATITGGINWYFKNIVAE